MQDPICQPFPFDVSRTRGSTRGASQAWPGQVFYKIPPLPSGKSNMALENGPLITDVLLDTSVHRGFSIAMLTTTGYLQSSYEEASWVGRFLKFIQYFRAETPKSLS